MKLSENWLRTWANPELSSAKLAEKLTMAGLEVESLAGAAGAFQQVVVAKVLKTAPHPLADRLTLCDVDAGAHGQFRVVCGATNVRTNLMVALALPGAILPGDWVIAETKLRGERSQGMLCAFDELGMSASQEGIMELPEDAPIGMCLRDYLQLDDMLIEIGLTPNRADCFSVRGIAREVSALCDVPMHVVDIAPSKVQSALKKAIHLDEKGACPRYYSQVIENINPEATTPLWMAERLRRSGLRCIHPVVDVMNYVMLELGQPLHAFDYDKVNGSLHVRMSRLGESLMLLDGQEITLSGEELVISDDKSALALAGVMGGALSGVTESTKSIVIESAYFQPEWISGTARRFGLSSDAAMRFERGVDFELCCDAIHRATSLLLSIVGGEAGPVVKVETPAHIPQTVSIAFDPSLFEKLTGLTLPTSQKQAMLSALGLTIDANTIPWTVTVPSYRVDLKIAEDLVEEVLRLYGYDNIVAKPWQATLLAPKTNPKVELSQTVLNFFAARGYRETISYSFVDPLLQDVLFADREKLQLLNPISAELSDMRVSLWPGLIASMLRNVHRQQSSIALFEMGVVFDAKAGAHHEIPLVGGLLYGETGALSWCEATRTFDFYDLKGDVEGMLLALGYKDAQFKPQLHDSLHPGKSAAIYLQDTYIGHIGILHPKIAEMLDIKGEVALFEVKLDALVDRPQMRYQAISKYPQIRRDLSFLVDKDVPVQGMIEVLLSQSQTGLIQSIKVFDVYMGRGIVEGQKSIAIAIFMQAPDKTLVDAEINFEIDAIIQVLKEQFSATLRDSS